MVPARGGGGECTCEDGYQWITGNPSTCIPTSQCDLSVDRTRGCCPQGMHWSKAGLTCEPNEPGKPRLDMEKTNRGR